MLKNDYHFTVYAISSHTDKNGYHDGYEQIVLRSFKNYKINIFFYYIQSVLHALLFRNYNLLHVNHLNSGFIIPLLKLKYRVISTLRGSGKNAMKYDKLGIFGKRLFLISEYILLKFSDIVVSVSKPHIEYYKKVVHRKILYIPNGINIEDKIPIDRVIHRDYILFAAGRILPIKGCHILLNALSEIDFRGKILIIGDLSQDPIYTNKIQNLSQDLDVEFLGLIKDKKILLAYLKKAKLFVFPSTIEAMSNMLLEAISMSTPIICSDIPENRAILDDEDVLFFKTNDVNNLAQKIKWALNFPSEMTKKAVHANMKLIKNYTWDKIAMEYDKLYKILIAQQ
ncbi:MAG: glycosyltransferase family 4 protein [Promethearchaeota archaeon]